MTPSDRSNSNEPLARLTTLGVGGAPRSLLSVTNRVELVETLRALPDLSDPDSLMILGGGSNVVISDRGFDGDVVHIEGGCVTYSGTDDGVLRFHAEAGARWDDLVVMSVDAGCTGIELMSGVPGSVGAAPIQNIAAYGQQLSDVIESVDVLDRVTLEETSLTSEECRFGFRSSRFKADWLDRFVILGVTLCLPLAADQPPSPSSYVDIVKYFETAGGVPTSVRDRRAAVLITRSRKSMLQDTNDPNARSVGSFFINPSVEAELAVQLAERFQTIGLNVQYLESRSEQEPGRRRIPAAHVLRYAGFNAGDSWGPVRLSDKHVLALVTTPGATATDVWNVGNQIRTRVEDVTGVRLAFEARFIGEFPEFQPGRFPSTYRYEPAGDVEPRWLADYRT